ncbi:unnamed protein product [Auanema sp. JU1783]|nr:unnamed protein product [Auanema sp. JU1783]
MYRDFTIKVYNSEFNGYILELESCVWIWVGTGNLMSLALSFYPRSTVLMDVANSQNIHIKSLSSRISNTMKTKQVFFSTDIEEEEPKFWNELYIGLNSEIEKAALTTKMSSIKLT